jgi:hypothetical protein
MLQSWMSIDFLKNSHAYVQASPSQMIALQRK